MRRWRTALLLAVLCRPLWAQWPVQTIEDFRGPAAAGRPLGWDVICQGAEATFTQLDQQPPAGRVAYRITEPGGTVWLLRGARLRAVPLSFEFTCRGGGEQLGVLLRDGVDDELLEYRAARPVEPDVWGSLKIDLKTPAASVGGNGKLDTLAGGGGLSLAAVTLRGEVGEQRSFDFRELFAEVDTKPDQAAMVDLVSTRFDGLYLAGDPPPVLQMLLTSVGHDPVKGSVTWTISDAEGRPAGSGQVTKDADPGDLLRLSVPFEPASACGHFTLRATFDGGATKRSATHRFAVVPATPDNPGRRLGATVERTPGAVAAWFDPYLLALLKRAGAGFARVELRWSDLQPSAGEQRWDALDDWLALSKRAGLPLAVNISGAPSWLGNANPADSPALPELLEAAARRAGPQVIAWEVWQRPNTSRGWPPAPQPYALRALLAAAGPKVHAGEPSAWLVNGGLVGFDPGFAGLLLPGGKPLVDRLGLAVNRPLGAGPGYDGDPSPSSQLLATLGSLRGWLRASSRPALAPWVTDVAVRTSPSEDSKLPQAQEMARCAALVQACGGNLSWHRALDGDQADQRWGLLRRDLEPKPSLAAFAAAAALGHGAVQLGALNVPGGFGSLVKRTGGLGVIAVGGGASLPALDAGVTITDGWGNPVAADAARLGAMPLYLGGAGAAKAFPMAP